MNARAEQLLGRPRGELVGERLWDLFPAAADGDSAAAFRRAMDEGATAVFEEHVPAPVDAWFELTVQGGTTRRRLLHGHHRLPRAQEQAERDARRAGLREAVAAAVAGADGVVEALQLLPGCWSPPWPTGPWPPPSTTPPVSAARATTGATPCATSPRRTAAAPPTASAPSSSGRCGSTLWSTRPSAPGVPGARAAPAGGGAGAPTADQLAPGRARELFEELAPQAVLVQPLRGRDGVLGVLTLFRGAGSPPFGADDLELLAELAEQAGVAIDNARLHAQQRDLAHELQASLLTSLPEPDHLQVVPATAPRRAARRWAATGTTPTSPTTAAPTWWWVTWPATTAARPW